MYDCIYIYIYIYIIFYLGLSHLQKDVDRLRVFKNRGLRVIFGHNREKMLGGGWNVFSGIQLHGCDSTPNTVMVMTARM